MNVLGFLRDSVARLSGGLSVFILVLMTLAGPAAANGPIGEHVNHLKDNLDTYAQEVSWMIEQVDGIVGTYGAKGVEAAESDRLIDLWESVKFHAAIETNYVPIYASIWQGLFAVKESIDGKKDIADVRRAQAALEDTLWQALGAVKLAAQYQAQGLLARVKATQDGPATPVESLDQVIKRLDRAVAKYAERLPDEALEIVHDTYLNLFEGVEGALIAEDAALVEDLEKDFNVTLPKALQGGASLDAVRETVATMHTKLERAKGLLADASSRQKDVF